MAKQFTLEQVRGECSAMHRHKGTSHARAQTMHRMGDQFLSRSTIALYEHRGLSGCRLLDRIKQLLHHTGVPNDVLHPKLVIKLLAKLNILRLHIA